MKKLLSLCALSVLLALGSCSHAPFIYLINNSGMTLRVLSADGDGVARTSELLDDWFFGLVWISNRAGKDVMYRRIDHDARFRIRLGGCAYEYVVPRLETSYNESAVLQLEPDRRLHVLAQNLWDPRDYYPNPVQLIPDQPAGFPLLPARTDC